MGVSEERIRRLVDHALLQPGTDGRFSGDDVHTARLVLAMEDAGIGLEAMAEIANHEAISLHTYPRWFPAKPVNPGRPYKEFADDLGVDADKLRSIYRMVGLPEPDPTRRIAEDEQSMVWELMDLADALENLDLLKRALASFSLAARLAVERSLALYSEFIEDAAGDPERHRSLANLDARIEPWSQLSRISPRLLAWLSRRQLESALDSLSVVTTERYLAEKGYVRIRPDQSAAVVFVDITGYTSITEEQGDRWSALLGAEIGDLASVIAEQRQGRLVKLLGDGAMLHFRNVPAAVEATIELVAATSSAGMPPLHIGMNAGSMVYRDGDYYGHTVNTAARLADVAPAGTIYATGEIVSRASGHTFREVGPLTLKGISQPVIGYALESNRSS